MPIGPIEPDSMAIQELNDGPFLLQAKMTDLLVDSKESSLYYHPKINVNTKTVVS